MPRQRYITEQIINKLRQAEVLISQGRSIREVAEELAISDHHLPSLAPRVWLDPN